MTQAQLADKLDISASTVGMYEQGRREPDNYTLARICQELGASVDYLLDIENKPYEENTDVYNVISDFIKFLETQDGLMFNGEPINKAETKRIASALKVATAVTISELHV